jgi:hypothetical protein
MVVTNYPLGMMPSKPGLKNRGRRVGARHPNKIIARFVPFIDNRLTYRMYLFFLRNSPGPIVNPDNLRHFGDAFLNPIELSAHLERNDIVEE